ncbi:hypothetical protein [Brevundimonas sp.]|uniref:hypothetical protein n=1 Tax=Brevundimonas sp. TaxID=1871086 RepID=UPI00391C9DE9
MKALTPLLATTSLLILAACASVDAPKPEPYARTESPAPTPIAGYDWHFNRHADGSALAYGVAESDDVRLSLHCETGTPGLMLYKDVEDGVEPVIHLESGGETERFPAESQPSMLSDGVLLAATADPSHPVFQRFRRVGWIASWVGDRREAYAAHAGSEAAVERFFSACG